MHPEFPVSPYDPLVPAHRWFPAAEALRDSSYEKLLPPLVATIRDEVHDWRSGGYRGASPPNALTVQDTGSSRIEGGISLRQTRPFRTEARDFVTAKKSVFNRIVGKVHGEGLELAFVRFLEAAQDVQAFAKNYLAVGFRLDYVKADRDLSTYTPDFIVRVTGALSGSLKRKAAKDSTSRRKWPVSNSGAPTPPLPRRKRVEMRPDTALSMPIRMDLRNTPRRS